MNQIIEYLTGMGTMTDQVIAMDLLMAAKSSIQMYSVAATEAGTPEVKGIFDKHLHEAIDTHEKIMSYMMKRGFYHPYDVPEQIKLDLQTAQTALNIPS